MKGFSEKLELIFSFGDEALDHFTDLTFDSLTVEPVPSILDTPVDLCNAEFLKAANKHATYHRNKKRIEREGRG